MISSGLYCAVIGLIYWPLEPECKQEAHAILMSEKWASCWVWTTLAAKYHKLKPTCQGNPQLLIEIKSLPKYFPYPSLSSTTKLTFPYDFGRWRISLIVINKLLQSLTLNQTWLFFFPFEDSVSLSTQGDWLSVFSNPTEKTESQSAKQTPSEPRVDLS